MDGVAWKQYDTPRPSGRGHSTDKTRVLGQKVCNSRSDRWIALKFFSRVFGGYFRWSSMESVQYADAVRSRPIHRQDQSTGSKGPYLEIRPLDLAQIFSRVSGGCFGWSSEESVRHADAVRSGPFHRQDESTGSKGPYLEIQPLDRAQILSRVCEGCFRWNGMESAEHDDGVRSGPFHRQDQSTGSKGPYLEIRPLHPAQIFFTSFRWLVWME